MKLAILPLRPLTNADYKAVVALFNLVHNKTLTEAEARHYDESRKADYLINLVLESPQGIIGAAWSHLEHRSKRHAYLEFLLYPDVETPQLQHELYLAATKELEPYDLNALIIRVNEAQKSWLDFFEKQGFKELERQWESCLNLSSFDSGPFQWALAKAETASISFKTLKDLPKTNETKQMLYKTIVTLLQEVPFAEPLDIWPYELWLERYWANPNRSPESTFLAFAGDDLVGFCELYKKEDPHLMSNGLTAVMASHRRKGIALSLKLKAAEYAKANAVREIWTTNHSINRPMLAINEALGFVKSPALIRLKKTLKNHD